MSLFNELKRRNVFRVGIAYVIVAWLVLQVADVILNNIEAPGWVFQAILLVLGIGFVIVLVFSWVFEMTPEGIKRESDIDRDESITPVTGKKLDRLITTVLVLALAYFVVDKFVLSAGRDAALIEAALEEAGMQAESAPADAGTPAPADIEKSIAVLPFVNMSEEASNEFFSDGISEEILNSLASVRELKVAGRTSSFAFKDQNQDLRQIGEALGVNHILEGSVRKAGDRVRITAQLVKVDDGFHLWSDTYDRELDDVFAIQDEIATAILGELKAALLEGEAPMLKTARTDSQVYELYLLAKQRMYERTKPALESAADLLDEAIALDPEYAPAYAQRGIATLLLGVDSYGDIPSDEAHSIAKGFLDKALELDENQAEAWAGLGLYYNRPFQPEKAIEALEKALSINPNLINAGNWLVLAYWNVNKAEEAMALLDEMTERDPFYKPAYGNRVFHLTMLGKTDEAREFIDNIEPFIPDASQNRQAKAWVDFAEGKVAAGLKRMQDSLEKHPTDRVFRVGVNRGYYDTHQYDKVFDDEFSGYYIGALFNMGRNEEALMVARKRAENGEIGQLFSFLSASGQSDQLVQFLEERWEDLDAFERDNPASVFGYQEMADIALAYRRQGNQQNFEDAMARLKKANEESLSQGLRRHFLLMTVAAYHALSQNSEQALEFLARAIDAGFITSYRISHEWPFFKDLDGNPEFEAIQARMREHLNRERELLGLEPV